MQTLARPMCFVFPHIIIIIIIILKNIPQWGWESYIDPRFLPPLNKSVSPEGVSSSHSDTDYHGLSACDRL